MWDDKRFNAVILLVSVVQVCCHLITPYEMNKIYIRGMRVFLVACILLRTFIFLLLYTLGLWSDLKPSPDEVTKWYYSWRGGGSELETLWYSTKSRLLRLPNELVFSLLVSIKICRLSNILRCAVHSHLKVK